MAANWATIRKGVVSEKLSTDYAQSRRFNDRFLFPYCANDSARRFHVGFAVCSAIQRRKSAEPPSTGSTTKAGLV